MGTFYQRVYTNLCAGRLNLILNAETRAQMNSNKEWYASGSLEWIVIQVQGVPHAFVISTCDPV